MRKRSLLLLLILISSHLPSDLMSFKNLTIPNDAYCSGQKGGTNNLIFSLDFSSSMCLGSELHLQHPLFIKLVEGKWKPNKLPSRKSTSYVNVIPA